MTRVAIEIQAILVGAVALLRRHRVPLFGMLAAAVAATVWIMPRDAEILATVRAAGVDWFGVAVTVSRIGRFENSTLGFAIFAAIVGLIRQSRRWKDIAVACLLAGLVAGISLNVMRPTLGRARPQAPEGPGFHWFELGDELDSMPSGHAMSNAASAFAIVPLAPVAVVPAVAYTLAMSWSRLQLNRHYPSDVLWGSLLGAIIGLAVGASIRDRRSGDQSTTRPPPSRPWSNSGDPTTGDQLRSIM